MNIKYLLILLGFAMLSFEGIAQIQLLKGHIYDAQSRQPLQDAELKTSSGQLLCKSDAKGYFELLLPQKEKQFKILLVGYKEQLVKVDVGVKAFNIQLETDGVSLNEVRVSSYNGHKTNKETAGAVAQFTARDIARGSGVSLQPALNAIPGVRMEQSTLSEARISIRGNGVRAGYGIRNVKVYVNEIPVTEADGTTRIEALDVNSIGRAEVIKGPASSIYGAGTAGVINFQLQRSPYQEQSLEVSGLAGAYGLRRLATTYRNGGDQVNSYVAYGWQAYEGYRAHSSDMRRFMTGNFQFFPDQKRMVTLLLNRTTQHSQIPGSLTAEQFAQNPLQANAGNLDKAAARYQNWTRIGLGQQYTFNEHFSNHTSVFTYFYDLNHPLTYAYLRNTYQSYGGRTRFTFDPGFTTLSTRFTAGAEYNQGFTKGTQYVNNHGVEGAISGNIDYENTQYSLFYQSETSLGKHTLLTLGMSYNSLNYNAHDYLKPHQSGIKKFEPQATPRIALSHHFGEALSLHGSISTGFSPPSSSEIKTVDGSINRILQAEKGINYEINAKGNFLKSRLQYDLALFKMDMKGELIAQSVQQGITIYNNAGKTSHDGVELALSYPLIKPEDEQPISSLRPFATLTYSDFTFKDYQVLNAQNEVTSSFNGNQLTGIAPWVWNAGLDVESNIGVYFYGNYFYSDALPMNDANTAEHPAYGVLNAKIGYRKMIGKSFEVNLYMGVDNVLNESYSSIVSLNAVGYGGAAAPYFNPSPKRNGYGGLNVKWLF